MRFAYLVSILVLASCATAPPSHEFREPADAPGKIVPRTALQAQMRKCVAEANSPNFNGDINCVQVDLSQGIEKGWLLLKDPKGPTHFLLVPTRYDASIHDPTAKDSEIVSGIEDSKLLEPDSPNYWAAAWSQREHVSKALGKPISDQALGLAANPPFQRTQDLLHVHMDCVQPKVIVSLQKLQPTLGPDWSKNPVALAGSNFRVAFIQKDDLKDFNPFQFLNKSLVHGDAMEFHALAVIGTDAAAKDHGFFVLDITGHPPLTNGKRVHAEDLLDPKCTAVH
jgi:CDP-diacylglycerol pyrophosphatase